MDLIARNPHTKELMGISVKSRTRGTTDTFANLGVEKVNITKLRAACVAFGCKPWFAFVVDAKDYIRCFLMKSDHIENLSATHQKLTLLLTEEALKKHYVLLV